MSDLLDRMRRASEGSRKLEHHFAADVLTEAIATVEHLQAAEGVESLTDQALREAKAEAWQEGVASVKVSFTGTKLIVTTQNGNPYRAAELENGKKR